MEKVTVYVAGNPDAYPVEYYDRGTKSFQGMIPELLRKFSQQSRYNIVYYAAGRRDQRERLARNRQVDVVSGLDGTEQLQHQAGEDIILLNTIWEGELVAYRLTLTDVAPETLRGDLENFLAGVAAETKTGLLIEAAQRSSLPRQSRLETAVWGLSLAAAVLAGVLLAQLLRHRRRIRGLRKRARTDLATGIGNMEYLTRRCQDLLNDSNRVLYQMLYIHLDQRYLERISNREELGNFFREMVKILQEYMDKDDVLARVSDQGFAVLRRSAGERASLEWLSEALHRIRHIPESGETCGAAAGVYPLKVGDKDLDELVFRSFQSACAAYQKGEDYQVCTKEVIRSLADKRRLREDIRRGLENGEFQIYIQFYVNPETGKIVGGEALPSWEHPERGLLSPSQLAPLIEQETPGGQLDYNTMERSCAFLEGLCQKGIRNFFLSFSVSRETAVREDFAARCREMIDAYQIPKGLLFLGVTDSVLKENAASGSGMEELRDMGIQVVLEDPDGASLYDIRRYALGGLKTGGRLMESPDASSRHAVLGGIVRMGHGLGVPVLAEGVETEEQANLLREVACDGMRGGLYFPPVPLWEARKRLLEQWSDGEGQAT